MVGEKKKKLSSSRVLNVGCKALRRYSQVADSAFTGGVKAYNVQTQDIGSSGDDNLKDGVRPYIQIQSFGAQLTPDVNSYTPDANFLALITREDGKVARTFTNQTSLPFKDQNFIFSVVRPASGTVDACQGDVLWFKLKYLDLQVQDAAPKVLGTQVQDVAPIRVLATDSKMGFKQEVETIPDYAYWVLSNVNTLVIDPKTNLGVWVKDDQTATPNGIGQYQLAKALTDSTFGRNRVDVSKGAVFAGTNPFAADLIDLAHIQNYNMEPTADSSGPIVADLDSNWASTTTAATINYAYGALDGVAPITPITLIVIPDSIALDTDGVPDFRTIVGFDGYLHLPTGIAFDKAAFSAMNVRAVPVASFRLNDIFPQKLDIVDGDMTAVQGTVLAGYAIKYQVLTDNNSCSKIGFNLSSSSKLTDWLYSAK